MPHSLTSVKFLLRKCDILSLKFFVVQKMNDALNLCPLFQDMRMQLVAVKKYLKTCRQAQRFGVEGVNVKNLRKVCVLLFLSV